MDLLLRGKNVFVTASTSGIGKAIADTFLEEGANVVINGRDIDKLLLVKEEFDQKYGSNRIFIIDGDISKEETILKAKQFIENNLGDIDILVPNLGSGKAYNDNFLDASEWERMMNINLLSVVRLLNIFIPNMKKQNKGSVILIASITGMERLEAPYAYSASKAGVLSLTKNLSFECGKFNVRVNAVLPGNVYFEGGRWEEIVRDNPDVVDNYIKKEVPMGRFATPKEIANSVIFLSSEKASFINGSFLVADGGQTRRY